MCREVGLTATYTMDVKNGVENECPVPGCKGKAKKKALMYRHFAYRHAEATLLIPRDGPLPRCRLCVMLTKHPEKHPWCKGVVKTRPSRTSKWRQERRHLQLRGGAIGRV